MCITKWLKLNAEEIVVEVPDGQFKLEISMSIQLTVLSELGLSATPDSLWGHALGNLCITPD